MRKLRTCNNARLNTGVSRCLPDFGKMIGAILVGYGTKLPSELTADKLEELAHEDTPSRIYGIMRFVEYAKEGGEPQTSAVGYGPEEITGYSALKETYTLDKFYPELNSAIVRAGNSKRGVYFFDENYMLYGINDGTDVLAPYPLNCVYSNATPHPTSSAKATMTVTFAHENTKDVFVNYDYVQLDFDPSRLVLGLTEVSLVKVGSTGNSYKIVENVGGYDLTPIVGPLIATAGETVFNGSPTAVAYNDKDATISVTITGGGDVTLKSPKALYEKDIKGIEQV